MAVGRAVYNGVVPFEELSTSPEISGARDQRTITREGYVNWANIDALFLECYPAIPLGYGRHPVVSYLYVDTIDITPWHPNSAIENITISGGVASHDYAKVKIKYARIDYESEDDGNGGENLLTRKWSFGGEFMTLPGSILQWEDGTQVQQEEINASKIIPSIEHSITLLRRPSINWTALRENIGKVCDGDFEGASDETLLFSGAEVSFEFNPVGAKTFTLDLRLQERFIKQGNDTFGWNHFYRKGVGWQKLKDDQGNLIYPKSNKFADLFKLA